MDRIDREEMWPFEQERHRLSVEEPRCQARQEQASEAAQQQRCGPWRSFVRCVCYHSALFLNLASSTSSAPSSASAAATTATAAATAAAPCAAATAFVATASRMLLVVGISPDGPCDLTDDEEQASQEEKAEA